MRPRKHPKASTALAIIEQTNGGTEIALPTELIGSAKDYAQKSKSKRTLRDYACWWRKFETWCDANGRSSMPAGVDTVTAFIVWMADGQLGAGGRGKGGKRWAEGYRVSISCLSVVMAAIKFVHKAKGMPFDDKHPMLAQVWGGIRRDVASRRTTRKAAPLTAKQLRDVLDLQRPDVLREARDAALTALGVVATLRRSEITGLDWGQLGEGEDDRRLGYVKEEDGMGLRVVLMRSKASQDQAQDIPIPDKHAPAIIRVIKHWVEFAGIEKGTPLFRGIPNQGQGDWRGAKRSGYVGVTWGGDLAERRGKPWRAQLCVDRQNKHLGFYATPREAYEAVCAAKGVAPSDNPDHAAVLPDRIHIEMAGNIVKSVIKRWIVHDRKKRGLKKLTTEELRDEVAKYSSHSMRAGGITSMAQAGVPVHQIKMVSRHKGDGMVGEYIRENDKVAASPMGKYAF